MKFKKQFVSILFISLLAIAIVVLSILLKSRVDSLKSIENLQSTKEEINYITSNQSREENNEVDTSIEETQLITVIEKNPYETLFKANTDYVGWIEIEDTAISYPILKGKDNDFYLDRGFDKTYDTRGSIFMDYRNFGQGFDQHTILYGHNMKDGTMFGALQAYKNSEFLNENPYVVLEDLYEKRTFKIISVYYDEANPELLQLQFNEGIEAYVEEIVTRSDYPIATEGIEITNLLTLVTCSYEVDDGRYFVHAIEVKTLD